MAKPDTKKSRHLRLEMTKELAPGISVTITYDDRAEIIEKLESWGLGKSFSSVLARDRQKPGVVEELLERSAPLIQKTVDKTRLSALSGEREKQ